jgi:hypothetical protein
LWQNEGPLLIEAYVMNDNLPVTLQILLTIVTPLIFLYLKGTWSLRNTVICLFAIPVLW